jgi:hypothetical protein
MSRAPITETYAMTKLSDTQAIILSRAARNEDRIVLPLPEGLRGGAAAKVAGALIRKGLVEEVDADLRADAPIWRETGDGRGVTLIATDAGLAAIGIAPENLTTGARSPLRADAPTEPAPRTRMRREGTKQAMLIAMLRAPEGATIGEIAAATGWQTHTVRGAISGALKKRLGLDVASQKVEGRGRVYRLMAA